MDCIQDHDHPWNPNSLSKPLFWFSAISCVLVVLLLLFPEIEEMPFVQSEVAAMEVDSSCSFSVKREEGEG